MSTEERIADMTAEQLSAWLDSQRGWPRKIDSRVWDEDKPSYASEEAPPPTAPVEVAAFLDRAYCSQEGDSLFLGARAPFLIRWRETWWSWRGQQGRWEEWSDERVDGRLQRMLRDAFYLKPGSNEGDEPKRVSWAPNESRIRMVRKALAEIVRVPDDLKFGDWLDPAMAGRHMIDFHKSRIEYAPGEGWRGDNWRPYDARPDRFTTTSLAVPYDPEAHVHPAFQKWLDDCFDEQGQRLLQEWSGYLLSGRQHCEKALQVIGLPGSGKGVYASVLAALWGRADARISLNALTESFALETLVTAPYMIVGDARSSRASVGGRDPVEVLLEIIGNDPQRVNRKNRTAFPSVLLPCRVMIFANAPVTLRDDAGALDRRWLFLRTRQSFVGREDTGLKARLTTPEVLAGVVTWALIGLERLMDNGWRFTVQDAAQEDREASMALGSHLRQFIAEKCSQRADDSCLLSAFHMSYAEWLERNSRGGRQSMTETQKELRAAGYNVTRPDRGKAPWTCNGVRLK